MKSVMILDSLPTSSSEGVTIQLSDTFIKEVSAIHKDLCSAHWVSADITCLTGALVAQDPMIATAVTFRDAESFHLMEYLSSVHSYSAATADTAKVLLKIASAINDQSVLLFMPEGVDISRLVFDGQGCKGRDGISDKDLCNLHVKLCHYSISYVEVDTEANIPEPAEKEKRRELGNRVSTELDALNKELQSAHKAACDAKGLVSLNMSMIPVAASVVRIGKKRYVLTLEFSKSSHTHEFSSKKSLIKELALQTETLDWLQRGLYLLHQSVSLLSHVQA